MVIVGFLVSCALRAWNGSKPMTEIISVSIRKSRVLSNHGSRNHFQTVLFTIAILAMNKPKIPAKMKVIDQS